MKKQQTLIVFFTLYFLVVFVSSISFEEDVTLTAQEKQALDKFKSLVIPKIPKSSYVQNYVNDDLYFIHWLRARRLNIPAAEEMFLNHLRWRENEHMDNITNDGQDWTQIDNKGLPVFFNDKVDKAGRPLGEFWFGDWNVRQGVLGGNSRAIIRSMARFYENLNRRIYKARAEGKEVSQASLILDLEGFNVLQQACPSCLPILLTIANLNENQYPHLYDTIFMINMPQAFEVLMRVVRPVASDSTAKAMKTFSTDRTRWVKALDEKIDKSQRSVRFGGTVVRDRE